MKFLDLTGKTFNRLTVIERAPNLKSRRRWLCRCMCGTEKIINGSSLVYGKTKSCGCFCKEQSSLRNRTHGESRHLRKFGTKEYNCWRSLIKRCNLDQPEKIRKHYGGRGIKVCNRWLESYENFLADVGRAPFKHFSLDRIDNNGNYEPGNVAWVSPHLQTLNRRNSTKYRWKWGPGATQWL